MDKIGWIGIGNMGRNMARRVLEAGYPLHIFDVNAAQTEALAALGASVEASPAALAQSVDLVFSTVPNGAILRAVTEGPSGVAAGIRPGTIFVDVSTVDVETSAWVAAQLVQKQAQFLRCPVSGSTAQARDGTLLLMVSGDPAAYEATQPLLRLFGSDLYYMGGADEARVMKLVIQSMVGVQFQSYAEALTLGEKAGVDWRTMVEVLSKCSCASTNIRNKTEAFKNRDFTPMSTVYTQLKDMNLVLDLARQYQVPVPVTAVSTQYYSAMVATGRGDCDYSGILLVNEENCGLRPVKSP